MIFSSDNVFASVFEFDSVDDEVVVVSSVTLHELNALSQLDAIVRPRKGRSSNSNDTAVELDALPFVAERALRFDDEPRSRLSTVYKKERYDCCTTQ